MTELPCLVLSLVPDRPAHFSSKPGSGLFSPFLLQYGYRTARDLVVLYRLLFFIATLPLRDRLLANCCALYSTCLYLLYLRLYLRVRSTRLPVCAIPVPLCSLPDSCPLHIIASGRLFTRLQGILARNIVSNFRLCQITGLLDRLDSHPGCCTHSHCLHCASPSTYLSFVCFLCYFCSGDLHRSCSISLDLAAPLAIKTPKHTSSYRGLIPSTHQYLEIPAANYRVSGED